MENIPTRQKKHKVVLIGSGSVGKTSIVIRFSNKTFTEVNESTIGAAFISRDIQTPTGPVSLHVWDTAGQERYRSLVPKYSQGASAIIIVYDISDPESFEEAKTWYFETKSNIAGNVSWFLVANKCDLKSNVEQEKVEEFANQNDLNYIETSAKTGQNVEELFINVASCLRDTHVENDSVDLEAQSEKKEGGCC